MKTQEWWKDVLLPKQKKKQWTWQMLFLFCVAVFAFIDSFFVPFSQDLDPGRSGEGMLFLILGFRAAARRELPTPVMIMGTLLAGLTSAMNHGLLKSPHWIWTSLMFSLLAVVVLWGRRLKDAEAPRSRDADDQSILNLSPKS